MSIPTYYITTPSSSGKITLWPMTAYGEICTSLPDAETKLATLVALASKGTKLSLEMQKAVIKNGQVEKLDGLSSVVKTVTA